MTFGVMFDNLLITKTGEQSIGMNLYIGWIKAENLFDICAENNLKQLWIVRESGFWKDVKSLQEQTERTEKSGYFKSTNGKPAKAPMFLRSEKWTIRPARFENVLTAWNKTGYKCQVIFCGLVRESWDFDKVENNPYLLFNAIELFVDKLNVLPSFPKRTAKTLFEASIKRKITAIDEDPKEYFKPFIEKMESEIIWLRKPTKAEKNCKFVHAFDKRMMFLSAARNGRFGEEKYQEIGDGVFFHHLPKTMTGLAEVEIQFGAQLKFYEKLFAGVNLFYFPFLRFFADHGAIIKIKKAWTWQHTNKTFESFSKTLGAAIKETRGENDFEKVANQSLKSIYTVFFGWLGRIEFSESYDLELFRPDWRGLIVAEASANLLRNVKEVETYSHNLPFAIYHDCLMYFSNDPEPLFGFNDTCLLDENRFTHEWTAPAELFFEALKDKKTNAGTLDKLGKQYYEKITV